jgi:hypothetical protein
MTTHDPTASSVVADAAVSALVELAVLPVQLAQALREDDRAALLRARTTLGHATLILDRALYARCARTESSAAPFSAG